MIFVGDDWSEGHHDVHVSDGEGRRLATRRFGEGLEGMAGFHALVASYVSDPGEVVIGIETDRGLWVQALLASGYQVFVINPLSMSRYRKMLHLSGGKSDPADARTLADMVRSYRHQLRRRSERHRPGGGHQNLGAGPPGSDLGTDPTHQPAPLSATRVLPRSVKGVQ
jgi:transposase